MITCSGDPEYSVVRTDSHSACGWRSCYYRHKEPALSFDMIQEDETIWFLTLFGPAPGHLRSENSRATFETQQWQAVMKFQSNASHSRLLMVEMSGEFNETFDLTAPFI